MNVLPEGDLGARIAASRHESNGIAVWALGQAGFLLQHRGLTVAIDPYLSFSVDQLTEFTAGYWRRNYPPPIAPGQLTNVDLVLCTHDHLDHTDPETLLAIASASPDCRFAGPGPSVEVMKKAGLPAGRLVALNEGKPFYLGSLQVDPIAAAHEDYETDAVGNHRYLGFLLTWDGVTLFHSGDTIVTPRLQQTLAPRRIDVAFLPINGRDEARNKLGIVGNMNSAEALELARRLKIDLVVPVHHDLYANNGAGTADFVACWEKIPLAERPKIKAFLPGEKLLYGKPDRSRDLAVIIGAGKTGRGFLARLRAASSYGIALIDRDRELIDRLNKDGAYTIHFFGGKRTPFRVDGITAALSGTAEACALLYRAAYIFTAVGESNLADLGAELRPIIDQRKQAKLPKLRIAVCENGASPAAHLGKGLTDRLADVEIGEAAIFCSTIELPGTRLDIQSEAYDELPYDGERLTDVSAFAAMKPVADFPTLLKRKIYTYNCFSAVIAYLGAFKGHRWYADAANDADISPLLDQLAVPLNQAIGRTFGVDPIEQERFSRAALQKFKNADICDDIARNARDPARKLAPHDRIIAPARLILETNGDIRVLALTAAALLYGKAEARFLAQLTEKGATKLFSKISGFPPESRFSRLVDLSYRELESGQRFLPDIFSLLS